MGVDAMVAYPMSCITSLLSRVARVDTRVDTKVDTPLLKARRIEPKCLFLRGLAWCPPMARKGGHQPVSRQVSTPPYEIVENPRRCWVFRVDTNF